VHIFISTTLNYFFSLITDKQFPFDRVTNDKAGLDAIHAQYAHLETRISHLHTSHSQFDAHLATFSTQLAAYETTFTHLQAKLEHKQSHLSDLLTNKNNYTVDPSQLAKDSVHLHTLIKDLNSADDKLLEELTAAGDYLLKNALDKTELGEQLNVIKSDFELVASGLNDRLKLVDEVQALAEAFNSSVTDLDTKLEEIDMKVKRLEVAAENISQLDVIELGPVNECRQIVTAAVCNFNEIQGKLNTDISILPSLSTPGSLQEAVEATVGRVQAARAECVGLLNSEKAFDQLRADLVEFMDSRRAQMETITGQLSCQIKKLDEKVIVVDALRQEIGLREVDVVRLTEKDSEASQKIKEEWNQLLEKAIETKQAIAVCSSKAGGFKQACDAFDVFVSECEDSKSAILSARPTEGLFSERCAQVSRLLEEEATCAGADKLSELEASGKDLKAVCQLDLELVDATIGEKSANLEMLKTSLGKLLVASTDSAKIVAEFSEKVAAIEAEITQIDGEITSAMSCAATEAFPLLTRIQERVHDVIPSTALGEAGAAVAELDRLRAEMVGLEERLASVQGVLEARRSENRIEAAGDEASLRAKEASLAKVRETLACVEEELKAVVSRGGSYEELAEAVKSLGEKSGVLGEMQAEEERAVREMCEKLVGLSGRIVKANEEIGRCGRDLEAVVERQEVSLGSPLVSKATIGAVIGEHGAYEEEKLVPIRAEVDGINGRGYGADDLAGTEAGEAEWELEQTRW